MKRPLLKRLPIPKVKTMRGSKYYQHFGPWDFTGMLVGNNQRWLQDALLKMCRAVSNVSTRKWGKVAWSFTRLVYHLYKHNGAPGVVLYLKTAQLCLMQAMAGYRVNSRRLGAAIARNGSGIPTCIPAIHRRRIREGDRTLLRVWLSLFALYRVIGFAGTLKLSTIVTAGKTFDSQPFHDFMWRFWVMLGYDVAPQNSIAKYVVSKWRDEKYGSITPGGGYSLFERTRKRANKEFVPSWALNNLVAEPFMISKKSAVTKWLSTFPHAIIISAWLWFRHEMTIFKAMTDWLRLTGNNSLAEFMKLSEMTGSYFFNRDASRGSETGLEWIRVGFLGRLSVKVEAAGKLRVFAIVDCWTQWLFKPLHRAIQKLLKQIPQDGTFDQLAPIRRLIDKFGGTQTCYSYDLSAATDRLPISIQEALLSFFIGPRLATAWGVILVGREYKLPVPSQYSHAKPAKERPLIGGASARSIRYAVGQPMGALSSWVMLALTHHLIVQMAAWNVRQTDDWYEGYAVLGDDLVIIDTDVAEEYLRLMRDTLGVGVNVHKSLVSVEGLTLEFAKRYYLRAVNCTPLSFKELSEARRSVMGLVEMREKYSLSNATCSNVFGFAASRARHFGPGLFSKVDFQMHRVWDILVVALFNKEWRLRGNTYAGVHAALERIIRDANRRIENWNDDAILPLVNRMATWGKTFYTEAARMGAKVSDTYVLRPPSFVIDIFTSLFGGAKTLLSGGKSLGWVREASEKLYFKDAFYFSSKAQRLIEQAEELKRLLETTDVEVHHGWLGLLQDCEALQKELDMIPKDLQSALMRDSDEEKLKDLRKQVAALREYYKAVLNARVVMTRKSKRPAEPGSTVYQDIPWL